MSTRTERFLWWIDAINGWIGRNTAYLLIPLVFFVGYEVLMRYVFTKPTVWSWEVNRQLFTAISLLGMGYVLLKKGHIVVDVLVNKLSTKRRALMDMITFPLFCIGVVILVWKGGVEAWRSLQIREMTSTSMGLAPFPLYTLKTMVPIGAFLLLIQGTAKFIRDLATFTSTKEV